MDSLPDPSPIRLTDPTIHHNTAISIRQHQLDRIRLRRLVKISRSIPRIIADGTVANVLALPRRCIKARILTEFRKIGIKAGDTAVISTIGYAHVEDVGVGEIGVQVYCYIITVLNPWTKGVGGAAGWVGSCGSGCGYGFAGRDGGCGGCGEGGCDCLRG